MSASSCFLVQPCNRIQTRQPSRQTRSVFMPRTAELRGIAILGQKGSSAANRVCLRYAPVIIAVNSQYQGSREMLLRKVAEKSVSPEMARE